MQFQYLVESFLKGVKNDLDDLKLFIEKRSQGAKKIAESAEKKGKYSTLTAIHFKAKEVPYEQAMKHFDDKNDKFIEDKADKCFDKLKDWKNMSQHQFQKVMGELEAYGEVFIRLKETKQ